MENDQLVIYGGEGSEAAPEQRQVVHSMFASLDEDHTGKLSRSEVAFGVVLLWIALMLRVLSLTTSLGPLVLMFLQMVGDAVCADDRAPTPDGLGCGCPRGTCWATRGCRRCTVKCLRQLRWS